MVAGNGCVKIKVGDKVSNIRAPDRDAAERDYMKGMKYKDIAEKHGVSINTVKSWKRRYKWDRMNCAYTKKALKGCTDKSCTQKKKGAKDNNQKSKDTNLNEREYLFCLYFVKNFNATQAAIKAGYSSKTAGQIGYQLLQKTLIKKEIDRLKKLKRQSIMVDEDDLVELNMRIAFADITDFVEFGQREVPLITKSGVITDDEGHIVKVTDNVVNFKDCTEVDGGLITEVKRGKQGISIKLESRRKAIDWLTDFFDMNPESKYRQEFNDKKLQLDRERFEHQKKMDEINNF